MIRVGIDASIDETLLQVFPKEVELLRIPVQPEGDIEVEFWIAPVFPKTVETQWPRLRGVKVVQCLWAGVNVLVGRLPPEITLCDARGVHDIPTAEWAVAAVLAMQKYFPLYFELQQQENWRGRHKAEQIYLQAHGLSQGCIPPALIDEVADATILIVGYGSIGEAIEARLRPFGANFLRIARRARAGVEPVSSIDDLLPQADIVILVTPLTSETRHLMDAGRLAKMKAGALLVNVSRGPVVDAGALFQALSSGRIRAAIDVTDPEPLPSGHELWKAPNLLITPHVAGASAKFIRRALKLAAEQVGRYMRGEPLENVVSDGY